VQFWGENQGWRGHLPEAVYGISRHGLVCGQQGHALDQGLGDEQAIKGIPVVEGQGGQLHAVGQLNRQPANGIGRHLARDGRRPILRQPELADADLDAGLPQAGGADEQVIGAIEIEFPGGVAQPVVAVDEPEEGWFEELRGEMTGGLDRGELRSEINRRFGQMNGLMVTVLLALVIGVGGLWLK